MEINSSERLRTIITKMSLKSSYWGYLFSRIRREADENIPSIMGVKPNINGTITLVYHPELLMNTSDEVLKKVIEHEGMHVLNKHPSRLIRLLSNEVQPSQKLKKSIVFNIAADCAVNYLIKMPKTLTIDEKPWAMCHADLYDLPVNNSTESYYHKLLKENSEDVEGLCDILDDHSEWKDISGKVPDLASLSRNIDNYIQDIIKDSLKNFTRSRGDLPGFIKELIDKALKPPKAPYFMIIKKMIKASRYSKFKRAFSKISRKRTYTFVIGNDKNVPAISPFPGRSRDLTFDIIVVIDVSGSMSADDIKEGLSGVRNIIEGDRYCRLTVIEIDTKIQKEYQVKRVKDIDFECKGRGGTVLRPALERCKALNPDVVLCFTDGGTDNINAIPRKELPKKIIYVIQKGGIIKQLNKTGYIVRIDD